MARQTKAAKAYRFGLREQRRTGRIACTSLLLRPLVRSVKVAIKRRDEGAIAWERKEMLADVYGLRVTYLKVIAA